ncbi:MAG: tRNA 2-thiouridine(34) synthase MnmA [Kiritimatiellae bacterium]|nr:tRNA 2-thiouridine(34) synthase MnmA [Kiritimatiellia bacterium]
MKVAVGLSGGVDSSVTALLLKEQGHEVVGITMKLWNGKYQGGDRAACFGRDQEDTIAAAELARRLGIEYRVFDISDAYDREIIAYFRKTYLSGKTPNPCVFCNRLMKFGLLPDLAKKSGLEFEKFATGHYARVRLNESTGRYELLRATCEAKDQSYFLCRLTQEQLARHIFPMGTLTKPEVREIARKYGLPAADRPDSQDFYSGEVSELLGAEDRLGDIVTLDGRKIGEHRGFWHYTVGQRKGLGIGGGIPYYVVNLNACRNEVIVGFEDDVKKSSLIAGDINWVSIAPLAEGEEISCSVKVRSAGKPRGGVTLRAMKDGEGREVVQAAFSDRIAGIAPGQSAVFYDSDRLLCAGIIK